MTRRSTPPTDPFDALVGYHLRRASVLAMTDLTRELAPLGLTPAAASVLFIIGANAGINQSEIGRKLGMLRANMAPLMASLLKKGLVLRTRLDGRSQALRLSSAGETSRRRAWSAAQRHEETLFGSLSAQRRDRMIAQLRDIWER